ncbi:MAG: outer membrane protein assembly factor BamA [candidate division WOR-3 bacterium]|nr:MAG: outer membrane protein assembly factor BamA [candidate division WOR-3 bacterium]
MILLLFLLTYTIVDVDVQATWTDHQLVIESSGIRAGNTFDNAMVPKAIDNLSRLRLFNFIAIDTSIVGDGIFVKIIVEEAPFLKGIPEFIGNTKLKDSDLNKKIELRAGQVLTDKAIFEVRNKILDIYKEKYFYETEVRDSLVVDTLNKAKLYFIIDEGIQPRIGKIIINGNESITDKKIKGKMSTKEKGFLRTGKLVEEKLEEDIENIAALFKENGFLNVVVKEPVIEVVDNRFTITIDVQENQKYYVGEITLDGNTVFTETALRNVMKIKTGDIYNLVYAEESMQNMYSLYADEGYIYCSIVPVEDVKDSVIDIAYKFTESSPANVKLVTITGNYRTREKVIRREIVTIPGQRYRRSDVIRSQREIFNLGFFEDIQILPGNPDENGNLDIIYDVKEKEGVGTIGAGVAYSPQDRMTGYVEFSHPNLFGRGQRLYTKLELGGRLTNVQLGFTEPWLFDTRTSAGIDLYYVNRLWEYYTKRDIGFATRVSLPFYLDYTRLGYGFRTERTQILDIARSYTPPETGYSLYDDTLPKWTIANSFSITRDSRDYIFNASSGSLITFSAEFAKKVLFANVDYNRYTLDVRTYFPIVWKIVLMTRLNAGVVTSNDEVPIYKRFYAGGAGSEGVRGYPDRSLSPIEDGRVVGGSAMLINNIELKMKLSQTMAFILFFDMGNTFTSYRDINFHDLYRGAGAGIRVEVPMIGVMGFDLGYGFDRENPGFEPHFQINPFGMF